jgi:hypothetical protein
MGGNTGIPLVPRWDVRFFIYRDLIVQRLELGGTAGYISPQILGWDFFVYQAVSGFLLPTKEFRIMKDGFCIKTRGAIKKR